MLGKASRIDKPREPIVQILWGIVKSANVDFAELFWEDFRFQINRRKNTAAKTEKNTLSQIHQTRHTTFLSYNPNRNKRLDSPIYTVAKAECLKKLKYVAKGEPKGKPTFGMPIPDNMLSKGLMRRSDMEVNPPKSKKQKDAVPRHSRTITFADNVLPDPNEALEYAKLVNMEETQQRETKQRSKQRHARIVLERQVNKELLLNLKRQSKESKKQSILEEFKRKPLEEDHEDNDNDSEHGDESDKSDIDEKSAESENDKSDKDSDDADDQTIEFVITSHDKEPEQTQT
ncbi:hypothetical protein Tco_0228822 [Tanacetum coccineum]